MSTTYEPGTVAVATVRGVPNVRVMLLGASDYPAKWASGTPVHGARLHEDRHVTDVRPLVVLDLDGRPLPTAGLDAFLKNLRSDGGTIAREWVARQIEAQTKPPRIPEPGLWGVVSFSMSFDVPGARSSSGWAVRRLTDGDADWQDGAGHYWSWDDLIDPVLIRDGIEDGAA